MKSMRDDHAGILAPKERHGFLFEPLPSYQKSKSPLLDILFR